jgi:hypothetical protein
MPAEHLGMYVRMAFDKKQLILLFIGRPRNKLASGYTDGLNYVQEQVCTVLIS